jgi:hypothetical protein
MNTIFKIIMILLLVVIGESSARVRWINAPILNDSTISACDSVGSGRWTQYGANGTISEDAEGIRLTTLATGAYTSAQLTTTFHKAHHNWYRITVRFDSSENVSTNNGLAVQFFSDAATANGSVITFHSTVLSNYTKGMVTYAWNISNMVTWAGTPTDSVARLLIRVTPVTGHVVNCWVSGIYGYNQPASDSIALISFGWDDYFTSQYDTIYKMMNVYGWKNSLFGSKTGAAAVRLTQPKLDTLIKNGWSLHTHIYDHSLDYAQRTTTSANNQLDSSINDIKSDYLRVMGKTCKTWPIGAYPANATGYFNDTIINMLQNHGIQWFSSTNQNPRQHEPRYRPFSFSNYFDYNTTTFSYFRSTLDSTVKYKFKMLLRGHDAVSSITQGYQIRIDSLQRIMDTIRGRELAGQLRVVTYDKFWLYAPDSVITIKSTYRTTLTYSVACSLSMDVDSMKLFLYDSISGGVKTLRDSSALTIGGGNITFTRNNLTPHTTYYYSVYGRNNSGVWDSTLPMQSVSTLSNSSTASEYTGKSGKNIIVSGSGFSDTSNVYLNTIRAIVTSFTDSTISFRVPNIGRGYYNLIVSGQTLEDEFRVLQTKMNIDSTKIR